MKWLLGSAAIAVIAIAAWGMYFSFDFKDIRAEAISASVAEAAEKTSAKTNKPDIKVALTEEQQAKAAEHYEGDVNAPIALYEFSSFSCSHCRIFHLEAKPNLQKYIDNGDLVVYFKDIFMDRRAAAATLLSRCITDNEAYWKFVKTLFETQSQWAFSNDYEKMLLNYASMSGLDGQQAKACMEDKNLLKALIVKRDDYANTYSIMGTPTIILAYNGKTEHVNHGKAGEFIASRIEEIIREAGSSADSANEEAKENTASDKE